MKAVSVAGGSPDTPETPEPEGTGIPATDPGTGDADPNPDEAKKPTPAAPAPAAAPEADAESAPEPAAAPEADVETDPESEAEVDAESDADAGPEAGADTDSEPGADRGAAAGAASEAGTEPGTEPGAGAEPESDAATEPGVDTESGADAGPGPEPESNADTDPEPGADPTSAAGSASEADTEPGTEPDTGAKTDAGAETGPEPGADAVSEADAVDTEADADAGPEPGADRGAAADAAADADPEPGAEADSGAGADAVAERAAADAAEPGPAGAEGGPDAEPSGGAKSVSAPEPEPKAADGAGPVPEPDADAGGGGEARRVPAWARGDEADAERTSTLVALKELDAPAKKATWPVAVPQRPTPPPAPAPGTGEVVEPTREVPAPAPPALDLLAELTNTPAPPETPRRTAVRRVKIWTPILLALAGAVAGGQLLRPLPEPRLVASDTAYTLDGQFSVPWPAKGQGALRVPGSGDIGTFGEQKPVPTASVAKVMTAYVILKSHPLRGGDPGPQIEIDAKAVADGASEHESRVEGLVAGTKFSQQDMLKMLMIPSANNVARLLARWDSGTDSEAAFVEKMNAAARELGMTNTTYTDPSGLDAATVSTAADQLKLADAVMKEEAFRAVVALPSAEIKGLSTPLYNNNTLLTVNGLSIRGIKTGSSTPAGGALMWAAYKSVGDETPLILGTLMDQHVDGPDPNGANSLILVQANSRKIVEAVRQALASAPTVRKGQQVGRVDDGLGGSTPLVATKDLNVIGVPGQRLKLTLRPGAAKVPHTAKAGTEIGVLTIGDGEGAKSVPVAVGTELAEPSFTARVSRLG
ncbi:serine hydrolase (plasmid) [Streptomyces goshikiensis]|uniref:serine hydrolase n=1 Tax=Streptomyces goshikiensis TaxID=1942 RepID=UPI002F90F47A|nr:serine hydrolase [Streptomyces goshikiensis]